MNDFEKIEDLLLTKRFEDLSSAELKEVNEYFENGSEYNDMRETLMQVKSTLAADKLLIKPPVDMKESLLNKFEQTYSGAKPFNPVPFYKKAAFQWSAAASVVILLSLGILGVLNTMGENKEKNMAVHYEKVEQSQPSAYSTDSNMHNLTVTGNGEVNKTSDEGLVGGLTPTTTEAPELKESNKPSIQTNAFSVEESQMEGESYNFKQGDVNLNHQEMKDDYEKEDDRSIPLKGNDLLNSTLPVYTNTSRDNSTIIDKKAHNTYQNKKREKNAKEDTIILQDGYGNTSIMGYTTISEMALDSIKVDSNLNIENRRAIIPKADSLEKQN